MIVICAIKKQKQKKKLSKGWRNLEQRLNIQDKTKIEQRQMENNGLSIIPKAERYIQYMLDTIIKLPRTEKFSIGTEYKTSMYKMMEEIIYLSKVSIESRYDYTVKIDALVQIQRIYLRLMKNNKWIDERKFKIALELLGEIGKINGGLIKFYAKNYKKSIW